MARITTVQKSRNAATCGRCGTDLPKGSAYRHASPGFRGRKLVRCMAAACNFRQSELTTGKMSDVYAAQESAHDDLDRWDGDLVDLTGIMESLSEAVEAVADEYREANDAWGSENGATNYEWEEAADELADWADEIRHWSPVNAEGEDVEPYAEDGETPVVFDVVVDADDFTACLAAAREAVDSCPR